MPHGDRSVSGEEAELEEETPSWDVGCGPVTGAGRKQQPEQRKAGAARLEARLTPR